MSLFVSDKVNAREKRESMKAIYRSNNSFSVKLCPFKHNFGVIRNSSCAASCFQKNETKCGTAIYRLDKYKGSKLDICHSVNTDFKVYLT